MKPIFEPRNRNKLLCVCFGTFYLCALSLVAGTGAQTATKAREQSQLSSAEGPQTFTTPQKAADALVEAAGDFDVPRLERIFGPEGEDIVFTGETARDRQMARDFAAKAHEKMSIATDPKSPNRAFLIIGDEDWPFPVPLVKKNNRWNFDIKVGRQEILYRRIGRNELDAIEICRGYVEAQHEYAFQKREGYAVHQYAQRIVSTLGKQDGLAWQKPDGTWGGPIAETVAQAIEQGYTLHADPYHGYFFKILKGQGPAAPMGRMDYVIGGAMIGGFALVAAPAEYGVTGVKTFIVSQDGVVYEKDFGENTLDAFQQMELFNPDKTWAPVSER